MQMNQALAENIIRMRKEGKTWSQVSAALYDSGIKTEKGTAYKEGTIVSSLYNNGFSSATKRKSRMGMKYRKYASQKSSSTDQSKASTPTSLVSKSVTSDLLDAARGVLSLKSLSAERKVHALAGLLGA